MAEPAARVTLARVAGAFLRRELAVMASYRLFVIFKLLAVVVTVAMVAFMASFVHAGGSLPPARYGAAGYLGFWLLGICVADLFQTAISALAQHIRAAQLEGTLEAMLATPAPTAWIVLSAPLTEILFALLRVAVYLGSGLCFGASLGQADVVAFLVTLAAALVAFAALGLLGGALTMTLRRTDPITGLVSVAALLLGGVLFPVDILPPVLRVLAFALPLGPALEGLRRALFAGAPLSALGVELGTLAAFTLVVAPAAAWLFARALRRARADGSLGHY